MKFVQREFRHGSLRGAVGNTIVVEVSRGHELISRAAKTGPPPLSLGRDQPLAPPWRSRAVPLSGAYVEVLHHHRDRADLGVYRNPRSGGKVASKRIAQVAFPEMIGDFGIS